MTNHKILYPHTFLALRYMKSDVRGAKFTWVARPQLPPVLCVRQHSGLP